MSSFIDSGMGLVLSELFVLALYSIEQRKQFYNCEAIAIWVRHGIADETLTRLQTLVNKSLAW